MRSSLGKSLALGLLLSACSVQTGSDQNATATAPADEANTPVTWSDQTAGQLRKAIDGRAAHGLDQVDFGATPADVDGRTRQALGFAAALARGASDPTKLYEVYTVPRPDPDLKAGLAAALRAGDLTGWFNSLAPQDANYRRLSEAYVTLRKQPAAPIAAIDGTGKAIEPGATDPRLPAIARELVVLDYLPSNAAQGDRYTPAMVAAVRRMQADYGMKPDGIIGRQFSCFSTRQSKITGPGVSIISMIAASSLAGSEQRMPWPP